MSAITIFIVILVEALTCGGNTALSQIYCTPCLSPPEALGMLCSLISRSPWASGGKIYSTSLKGKHEQVCIPCSRITREEDVYGT